MESEKESAARKAQSRNLAVVAFSAGMFVAYVAFSAWPRWRDLKEEERRQTEVFRDHLRRAQERLEAEEKNLEPPK